MSQALQVVCSTSLKNIKCDWKSYEGKHSINKKYPRNSSVTKGKVFSIKGYENERVSSGLEPWIINNGQGITPNIAREKLVTDSLELLTLENEDALNCLNSIQMLVIKEKEFHIID